MYTPHRELLFRGTAHTHFLQFAFGFCHTCSTEMIVRHGASVCLLACANNAAVDGVCHARCLLASDLMSTGHETHTIVEHKTSRSACLAIINDRRHRGRSRQIASGCFLACLASLSHMAIPPIAATTYLRTPAYRQEVVHPGTYQQGSMSL